jgi:hypothetical protein
MSIISLKEAKYVGIFAAFLALSFFPVFVFGNTAKLYVDGSASGTADGSASHPYRTISEALDHADGGTEVHVASGHYGESITIPKDVEVFGVSKDRSKVVIDGGTKKPTVTMKHSSALNSVTVKDGSNGIYVKQDSNAHVFDVVVKDAEKDGIYIESAPKEKKYRAFLDTVDVKNSGRSGIYSEKRYTLIVGSDIHGNDGDGVAFQAGVKGWLEDNKVYGNSGSGWSLTLDGSDIWTRKNDFRKNDREGVQVESFGVSGNFGFKSSKAVDNGRYGIALVARNAAALAMWKGIFIEPSSSVFGNTLGQTSRVMFVR